MIDYDATLKNFFAEVIKYLERLRANANDEIIANRITAAIDVVKRISANPMKYADFYSRAKGGVVESDIAGAFIPAGTQDNSVYLTYSAVVNSMGDLSSTDDMNRKNAQQKLLAALKTLKYKNSTDWLKSFTFAFKSPKSFAVQSTKQYEI